MKIFRSLNCSLCLTPFAPDANQPRSPRILNCGEAICNECFEREKSLKQETRNHQCKWGDKCFDGANFAYFLIDILSQDSLKLSPIELGYILIKPFQLPECHICHEEYSNNIKGKSSFVLSCNHAICTDCYLKTQQCNRYNRATHRYDYSQSVACPVCQKITTTFDDTKKNRLQDFLAELPAMTRALEEMSTKKYRFCEECTKLDSIDEMFYCKECQKGICGVCVVRKHRLHNISPLLETEASEIVNQLQKASDTEIKAYHQLFPALHKEIVEDIGTFKKKLISKEGNLVKASNFEDFRGKHETCKELKKDFETISEEYMPHLRTYDTKVKNLIAHLDKNPN